MIRAGARVVVDAGVGIIRRASAAIMTRTTVTRVHWNTNTGH